MSPHGLVACEHLCGSLFCLAFQGILSSQWGVCVHVHECFMLVFPGRGESCILSEAAGILGSEPSGLQAEWRLHLRCPLAGWCHVGSGLTAAGRAGQGLWWALDPRPALGINIPGCRRQCLLCPSLGVAAAQQVLGAGWGWW